MYQISALSVHGDPSQRIAIIESNDAGYQWLICPFDVPVSPWLLIHRQGLFDDHFEDLAAGLDGARQISTLVHVLDLPAQAHSVSRGWLVDALERGSLKAYKLPYDPLWDVRQHSPLYFGQATEGNGADALTCQLVHEMGTHLVARWHLADGVNAKFYAEPWYRQAAVLATEFSAGAMGVIQDFANLLASIGKAVWRAANDAFDVVVNLDVASLKANFSQLAEHAQKAYGWVIESAEKLADMIAEGARMLKRAMSLPRLPAVVAAYLDGLTESLSAPQRARLIGSFVGEIGLDVLLTIFTLGTAVAARHAMRAGKAATAMVGPFSTRMLELIAKLSKVETPGFVSAGGALSVSNAVSPSELLKLKRNLGGSGKYSTPPSKPKSTDNGSVSRLTREEKVQAIRDKVGSNFKNHPLRQAYEGEVKQLSRFESELMEQSIFDKAIGNVGDLEGSERAIARRAHEARRQLGVKYKNATPEPLRDFIYDMNKARYGDPLGPTFKYLVSDKNKSYLDIINSSSTPNSDIDKLLAKFEKWLGKQNDDTLERYLNSF